VRPIEVLSLLLGKQEWTQAEQVREHLVTTQTHDLYWDASIIDDSEPQHSPPGIYLFGSGRQSYRAFDIEETDKRERDFEKEM
jgi:hypothetical protein